MILLNFLTFSNFFSFFCTKNLEKADFKKHLECSAPKGWSKYTTLGAVFRFIFNSQQFPPGSIVARPV